LVAEVDFLGLDFGAGLEFLLGVVVANFNFGFVVLLLEAPPVLPVVIPVLATAVLVVLAVVVAVIEAGWLLTILGANLPVVHLPAPPPTADAG